MTYAPLLTAIYADYDRLWALWTSEMERAGDIGVLAFLPDGYEAVSSLDDAVFSYWRVDKVRLYLQEGRLASEDFEALVDDVAVAEEFLVMIVESPEGPRRRSVHVHRVTRLNTN